MSLMQSAKGAKTAMVLDALSRMVGEFSVKDVQDRCSHVGIDLIRRIMRK